MNYVRITEGIKRDELLGGLDQPVDIFNVNVGQSAIIERGQLLCASSISGVFELVDDATDAEKILCIAAGDFTAEADNSITQAYMRGKFNRDRVKLGGSSLTLEPFEQSLRLQNILLTKEVIL